MTIEYSEILTVNCREDAQQGPGGWRSGTRRASRYFRQSAMATASATGEGRGEWRGSAACLQRTCRECRGRSDGSYRRSDRCRLEAPRVSGTPGLTAGRSARARCRAPPPPAPGTAAGPRPSAGRRIRSGSGSARCRPAGAGRGRRAGVPAVPSRARRATGRSARANRPAAPRRSTVTMPAGTLSAQLRQDRGERRAGFVERGGRRPVEVDPRVAREIFRGDGSGEQRVIAPGDDAGGHVEETLAAQERRQGFVGVDAAAMQVAVSVGEAAQPLGTGGAADAEFDGGEGLPEAGGRAGEHGLGPRRGCGDAEHAGAPRSGGPRWPARRPRPRAGCAGRAPPPWRRARSGRTPCGRRSNSFPPKRCSSRAMSRVSVGWVTFERFAAAPIVPVSATASSLSKSVRLSNMATFPELGRPAACSLGLHVGVRRRLLNRLRAPGPARLRGRGRNRGFPLRRALRHTRCVWILPQTAFSFCTSCR